MMLLEVRDLRTNDLLTTYDLTEVADVPGTMRAVELTRPATACTISVERDEPLGELTDPPAAVPEDGTDDPVPDTDAPSPDPAPETEPTA